MRTRALIQVDWTRFVLYLLEPHQAAGGWVRPEQIAQDLGLSRASAYRYIAKAEAAGLPLQVDMGRSGGKVGAGVRCMVMTARRPPDASPLDLRRKEKPGRGRARRKGRTS